MRWNFRGRSLLIGQLHSHAHILRSDICPCQGHTILYVVMVAWYVARGRTSSTTELSFSGFRLVLPVKNCVCFPTSTSHRTIIVIADGSCYQVWLRTNFDPSAVGWVLDYDLRYLLVIRFIITIRYEGLSPSLLSLPL